MTRKGLIFLVFTICAITLVKADVNSEWRKPDDWSRHRREVEHQEKLKAKENVENGLMIPQETCKKDEKTVDIAKMSYMRVMRKVFNKQRFKVILVKYGSKKVLLSNLYYRRKNLVYLHGQCNLH